MMHVSTYTANALLPITSPHSFASHPVNVALSSAKTVARDSQDKMPSNRRQSDDETEMWMIAAKAVIAVIVANQEIY